MEAIVPSSEYTTEFAQGSAEKAKKEAGAKGDGLLMVPVEKLVIPGGFNIRIHDDEYQARVEEVCDSIIENGFYRHMPLPVYVGKEGADKDALNFYYVTGGFTRLAAVKLAIEKGTPIEAVPCVPHPPGTSMLDLTYRLVNDNTGNPLKPYEKGIAVKRAIGMGQDVPTIARKMGVSDQYINNLLYLHGLPQATQALVINGRISAKTAIELSRQLGPAEALKQFETAVAEGAPPEGEGDPESSAGTAAAPRQVTPRQARSAGGNGAAATPKQQLAVALAAIDYSLALPGDNMDFLSRWRKGEKEATAEVAATLKPPTKKEQAAIKAKEKAAAKAKADAEKAKRKADREKKAKETAEKKAAAAATAAAKTAANVKSGADIGL